MHFKVKDIKLAPIGKKDIHWAESHMPVLMQIMARFQKEKPLKGLRIGACLHVTKETAVLIKTLKAGGADVSLCGSNPLSTNNAVAAALAKEGTKVYAWHGVNENEYYECVDSVLEHAPQITMDDGGDLVSRLHTTQKSKLKNVIAGTEETTTGVIRHKAMARNGILKFPIIDVNDAQTKHFFDNRYGTGQSTLDGILRATSVLIAGKVFVVCGYGWCGRGLAMRAKGMGARVVVTEVDPVKALEAVMDGYDVMPIKDAAKVGDVFCTVTGDKNVIDREAIDNLKEGAILSNSGHFNSEINISYIEKKAKDFLDVRQNTREYHMKDGRTIYLLAEGRLVNLAAAEGHPSEVMDMSFANQALTAEWLAKNRKGGKATLKPGVYPVPQDIDRRIAELKLESMGIKIDVLTEEQKEYLKSWNEGT